MKPLAKRFRGTTRAPVTLCRWCFISVLFLGAVSRAQAGAALLLEEPYSYDGTFAGTGHAAVYLDHVCAASPILLRPCGVGESGVVLSRYKAIAGYDWIAIPLIPYLYAVENRADIPLFADQKLVVFLRDQYRRKYLESLAPDRADGSAPGGDWYELVGSAYDRTTYAFAIQTSGEQDALLISRFNGQPNRKRYSFIKNNCADFAREVINFYYPHAAHRSVIGDLGVSTPKQIAKTLEQYGRRHRELETKNFVIPQVPGAMRRSKPIRGVLESGVAAKKYMVPLFLLHPYISGSLLAAYLGHWRFDPAKHALVMDSSSQLDTPLTAAGRRVYENRLNELTRAATMGNTLREGRDWDGLHRAEPGLDPHGMPVMKLSVGKEVEQVGVSRANVLNASESLPEAAKLMEARLHQELGRDSARKTAHTDVENDLELLQQLLAGEPMEIAGGLSSASVAK